MEYFFRICWARFCLMMDHMLVMNSVNCLTSDSSYAASLLPTPATATIRPLSMTGTLMWRWMGKCPSGIPFLPGTLLKSLWMTGRRNRTLSAHTPALSSG